MPPFLEPEDVSRWLTGKPREVAIVFAARASLRAVPLIPWPPKSSASILRTFRCNQAAFALAAYPGEAARLRSAANAAASRLYDPEETKLESAEWASAAAASSGDDTGRYAFQAAASAIAAAADASSEARADFLNSCAADADLLDQRYAPTTLALSSTLWPKIPDWAVDRWTQLEHALLDAKEDWEVWTDWYEARLKGGPTDPVIELARAKIPNGTWDQGPRVVNGQIQSWYDERSISHRATQAEALPPESRQAVERLLRALTLEQLHAIGVRTALRAIPLVAPDDPALLRLLRLVSLGWTAASYPNNTPNLVPLNAARIDAANTGLEVLRAAAGALSAFSASPFESILVDVSHGIDVLRSASTQADGRAAGAVFALALAEDVRDLRDEPDQTTHLARNVPLWSGGAPPEWQAKRWDKMKRGLIEGGEHWNVWVKWYENRIEGNAREEPYEFAYVETPGRLWGTGGAAEVNQWISRRLSGLEDHADGDAATSDVETGTASIPSQRPAAIEPVWSAGKLSLPKAAAKSNLKGGGFASALKSLRGALTDFASDIAGEANLDPRVVAYVQKLAARMPQKVPRQTTLFQLAHAGEELAAYVPTADAEWPPFLASRFRAIVLHYERTMRQSSAWQEFKRNAALQSLTPQQVDAAASLAGATARALREAEAATFADPAIPEALENLAATLQGSDDVPATIVEAGKEELAFDLVESVNNVLKRVGEEALLQAGTVMQGAESALSRAGADYAHGVGKGFRKAAKRQGPKDGAALFKWLRRVAIAGGGIAAGSAAGLPHLITVFPQAFAWLERLAGFIP